jgi:CRP-like cAMP-binding protein
MRTDPKIQLLRRLPLFAAASTRELQDVASRADEIDVPAGYTLTREGERGREFVVLIEGAATVEHDGETIATLGPGDFLGESARLHNPARTATVRTTAPSRLLVITDRDFRALVDAIPSFGVEVYAAAHQRL